MHEASLVRGLIRQIEDVVRRERGRRALAVDVTLGALSHFSPEHFVEHFDREAAGSLAEGARVSARLDTDERAPHAQNVVLHTVEVSD